MEGECHILWLFLIVIFLIPFGVVGWFSPGLFFPVFLEVDRYVDDGIVLVLSELPVDVVVEICLLGKVFVGSKDAETFAVSSLRIETLVEVIVPGIVTPACS